MRDEVVGKLSGKTAVITGGASGIGLASAERFAAEGARVILWDIDIRSLDLAASRLSDAGAEVLGVQVDVSRRTAVEQAVERSMEFAGGPITVLMNNAGLPGTYVPVLETEEDLWDRVIGVNLTGPYQVSRALLPSMLEVGGGVIVNTCSIASFVAGFGAAYAASKAGLLALTRELASDYGSKGIRVNAICPGAVETGMTRELFSVGDEELMKPINSVPAGRHGRPEEIAALALFLASEESSFIHGAAVVADGGWTIR
ncbi:SDR family NAD(P)-dependent oxidoreductase [Sinosporangium siamense]